MVPVHASDDATAVKLDQDAVVINKSLSSYSQQSVNDLMQDVISNKLEGTVVHNIQFPSLDVTDPNFAQEDYVIGVNDLLYIDINGLLELSSPRTPLGSGGISNAGFPQGIGSIGSRVDGNGNVNLPVVGTVKLSGLTLAGARKALIEAFTPYIKNPWVVIEISGYRSKPVYLSGEFTSPGVIYLDRPVTLLQAISLGGGPRASADLLNAKLIRNNRVLPIDIYALLQQGQIDQNIPMRADDTVFFPNNALQRVFVLGQVANPGQVVMPNGLLTLPQAIAAAGGLRDTNYNANKLYIIRSFSATKGQVIKSNLNAILRDGQPPFKLQPGDVVFIDRSGIGLWNQLIASASPTLSIIQSLISPFATLVFLNEAVND